MSKYSFPRFLLLLVCVIAGCGKVNPTPNVPNTRVTLPETRYLAIVWQSNGQFMLNYMDDPESLKLHIAQTTADGTDMREVTQPENPNCSHIDPLLYGLLPNGQVQIAQHCYPLLPPKGRGIFDEKMYLVAYDPNSGEFTPLLSDSIYTPEMRLPIAQITWNPSMQRGMLGTGGGLYETLAWLTPHGYEDATITIRDGTRAWRLDELFHGDLGHPSSRLGNASLPAWSPDGNVIAFFASPQNIDVDGFARLDTPWNLYLMNPQDQKPSSILRDIQHPQSLIWSPNGQWLAFGGQPSFSTEGLWLFNPTSKTLKQVNDKSIEDVAWSPDGRQIAAIFSVDDSSRHTQVWRYDVSKLISSQ